MGQEFVRKPVEKLFQAFPDGFFLLRTGPELHQDRQKQELEKFAEIAVSFSYGKGRIAPDEALACFGTQAEGDDRFKMRRGAMIFVALA